MNWVEILGIIATCFVLVSFLMKKVLWIRVVNLVGAVIFVIYGALLGAWSVWILNACLVVIQIYYIIKICKEKNNEVKD